MWRQRSQVQWLSEGDSNTYFFHKVACSSRRVNIIMPEMVGLSGPASVDELKSRVSDVFEG